jgi:ABC-type branched-subunit amino acid transport system substrate-binding protein
MARPISREFVAAIKKAGGATQANYSSMEGYLAARLFTEGLEHDSGKGPPREGLIRGLESLGNQSMGGFCHETLGKQPCRLKFCRVIHADGRRAH